jgi:hypothetical protein
MGRTIDLKGYNNNNHSISHAHMKLLCGCVAMLHMVFVFLGGFFYGVRRLGGSKNSRID